MFPLLLQTIICKQLCGRLFQSVRPSAANAQSPTVRRWVRGTSSCSEDADRHSMVNSTADQLNGLRQSYHPQHTLHELRARRLSKIHSTVDPYSTTSDFKDVEKLHPQFEHSRGHITSRHMVANRCEKVNTARKLDRRWLNRLQQRSCSVQPMSTQVQSVPTVTDRSRPGKRHFYHLIMTANIMKDVNMKK